MKKKGLALLLAATMICGLAACGKSGGETKTDAAADTAQTEDTGDTAGFRRRHYCRLDCTGYGE